MQKLIIQAGKKTLSHRIVISIAHTARGEATLYFLALFAKLNAGVLTAVDTLLNVRQQFGYY